jgi:hypothetical protein
MVPIEGEMRQVWRAEQSDRRAAKLERGEPGDRLVRAADYDERGLMPRWRVLATLRSSRLPFMARMSGAKAVLAFRQRVLLAQREGAR